MILSPCQKCGEIPTLRTRDIKWLTDCTIRCNKCGMFVYCETQEGAIMEWEEKNSEKEDLI